MSELLYILAIPILLYGIYKLVKNIKLQINLHKLDGPPTEHWFFGNILRLHDTPENMFKIFREFGKSYFPIYKIWIGPLPAANILSPEDFETVLSNMKHNNKSIAYLSLIRWLRDGLLLSKGNKWQERRKILTPAFHFTILREFTNIFNRKVDDLVASLKKESHKPFIEVNPYIVKFTLATIAETSMGIKLHFNTEHEREYETSIHEMGQLALNKMLHPWELFFITNVRSYMRELKLIKVLHGFTKKVIEEQKKRFKMKDDANLIENENSEEAQFSTKKRLAMLNLLLTAKDDGLIDDVGIHEEVDTFMFEGHDTTAMALCFSLMVLACHKDAQEQIVQEIEEILGALDRKPTFNELQQFQYLERCIKEILRLYPSVPFISRSLGEDFVSATGHRLSEGSLCHLHIYDLHRNPEIFPDPEKFDPDRFLPENCQNRHPYAYAPFSAGPRNCIGQRFAMLELKTVLIGILSNFVLEPVDTPSTLILVVDLVLRAKENIKVKFVPRTVNKNDKL